MEGMVEESAPVIERVSADLAGSAALAIGIGALALVVDGGTAFAAIWLPFVAFVPGYTLVCAAFPRGIRADSQRMSSADGRGITLLERFALSVATSVVLVGLVGLAVRTVGLSGRSSLVVSVGVFTVLGAVVATLRRGAVPSTERFEPDLAARLSPARAEAVDLETRRDLTSVTVVGLVVLLVVSGAAYAMAGPGEDTGDTALYLLASDGETAAEDYPDTLTVGEESSLIVGIQNDEGQEVTYTVVVQLQEVDADGDGLNVESATELDRFDATLEDGETLESEHVVTPDQSGENLRLTYLLYVGEPPDSPGEDDAYRSTYVWVDVTDGE